jgi:hypothetical protein
VTRSVAKGRRKPALSGAEVSVLAFFVAPYPDGRDHAAPGQQTMPIWGQKPAKNDYFAPKIAFFTSLYIIISKNR